MLTRLKRYGLAAALAAGTFTAATSAEARDRGRHHGDGDEAAAIIGAGIVGLAIGAMIADRDDDYYYDRSYYRHRRYVSVSGYPGYYYYYDGYPNRYYRDRYYGRYYGRYYSNRWDRGYDRVDRWYGRGRGDYDRRYYRRDYRGDRRRWRD